MWREAPPPYPLPNAPAHFADAPLRVGVDHTIAASCLRFCAFGPRPVSAQVVPLGLVPSINNGEHAPVPPFGGADVVEIDKVQSRCTRLRKNLGVAAKLLSNAGSRQPWMLTLTYADATAWRPDHVKTALMHLRKWAGRRGFPLRYLWVMETKARKSGDQIGTVAPHYHVVVWLPHGVECPALDSFGWWLHGMTNTVKAVAPVRYVMKYTSKFEDGDSFPKGARVYGIGGLSSPDRCIRRWVNWPSHVQGNGSVNCPWRRNVGGGWVNRDTGEFLPSEWGIVSINRKSARLVRLRTVPRFIDSPSGPYSFLKK